jgi:hypothetical protein
VTKSKPKPRPYNDTKTGRFVKGNPGRPPGIPMLQEALIKMIEKEPDKFARVFKEMLEEWDPAAWGLLLKRAWPEPPKQVDVDANVDSKVEFTWKKPPAKPKAKGKKS